MAATTKRKSSSTNESAAKRPKRSSVPEPEHVSFRSSKEFAALTDDEKAYLNERLVKINSEATRRRIRKIGPRRAKEISTMMLNHQHTYNGMTKTRVGLLLGDEVDTIDFLASITDSIIEKEAFTL